MTPMKRKMEFSAPIEGKLMGDAMKITRTSRRLAKLKAPTTRGSNSEAVSKVTQPFKVIKKGESSRRGVDSILECEQDKSTDIRR